VSFLEVAAISLPPNLMINDRTWAKVLPMSPVSNVTYVSGTDQEQIGALGRIRTADPQIRSLMLYPAELRALAFFR
jgi:hypothetical protein